MIKVSKKTAAIVAIIAMIAMLFFISTLVSQKIKYSDYVTVNATIVDTKSEAGTSDATNMNYAHFITYKYQFDGNTYTATQRIFTKICNQIGKSKTIRCNFDNPQEIENMFLINTCIAMSIFFGFISILLIIIILRENKRDNFR